MSTHDYNIANASGASVRQDINNALAAILSNNSNASSPSTTVAYMLWADTTSATLKIRNSANDDWVELFQLDGTLTLEDGSASTPALAFRDDLNTGIFSAAADEFNIATGGVERVTLSSGATVFNQGGSDTDFRIEGDTNANLFYVDAGNNRVAIGTSSPTRFFHVAGNTTDDIATFINADTTDGYGVNIQGGGSASTRYILRLAEAGGTEKLRVSSAGKVGIGSSSPTYNLEVKGSGAQAILVGSTNAASATLILDGDSNGDGSGSDYASIQHTVDGNIEINNRKAAATIFKHNISSTETEIARFSNAGNLGIGTTNPQTKLHLDMGAGGLPKIRLQHSSTGNDVFEITGGLTGVSNSGFGIYDVDETAYRFVINSSGNVGIGTTTPDALLHLKADDPVIRLHDTSSDRFGQIVGIDGNLRFDADNNNAQSNTNISFRTDGTERMRITGDGPHLLLGGTSDVNEITETSSNAGMVIGGTGFGNGGIAIINSTSGTGRIYFGDAIGSDSARNRGQINYQHSSDSMVIATAGTPRITINSSGLVTIAGGAALDTGEFGMTTASGTPQARFMDFGFLNNSLNMRRTDGGETNHINFLTVASSLIVSGDLNDTSDEKLKKNIASIADGAIAIIKQLRPVTFDWIDENRNNNVSGFIAQEIKSVLPNLVYGTEYDPTLVDETKGSKGGIKSEGYSVNTVGITAHLTKALQEAIAKIEILETKVAALEAA